MRRVKLQQEKGRTRLTIFLTCEEKEEIYKEFKRSGVKWKSFSEYARAILLPSEYQEQKIKERFAKIAELSNKEWVL